MEDRKLQIQDLEEKALDMRKKLLKLAHVTGSIHIGGDLSMTDMIVALYNYKLNIDKKDPKWPGRDRFILSKGHGSGALYLALANATEYFDEDEVFGTYNKFHSRLSMHPDLNKCPGIEMTTGSLGHGLSVAVGMALAARLNREDHRVYCMLGDGECHEGSNWEAAMAAPQFCLGNLIAIVDRNMLSLDGPTEELMKLEPFGDKWRSFNWNVMEIDGNDMAQVVQALDAVPPADAQIPTMIISKTIKGRGIGFMENNPAWHGGSVDSDMLIKCYAMLDTAFARKE